MECICRYNRTCNKEKAIKLCAKVDYECETGRKILTQKERDLLKKIQVEQKELLLDLVRLQIK